MKIFKYVFLVAVFFSSATSAYATEVTYRFYSLPGDGYVLNATTTASKLTTIRSLVGTESHSTEDNIIVGTIIGGSTNNTISRGFLPFDTSLIPQNAKIKSASVHIWAINRNSTDNGTTLYQNGISVVGPTTQLSTSTLLNGDYSHVGHYYLNTSDFQLSISTKITAIDPFSTSSYSSLIHDQNGLDAIIKSDITQLGIRNNEPSVTDLWSFYSSEGPSDRRPYLDVVVDIDPTSPTDLKVNDEVNPPHITTALPTFSAVFQSATSTAQAVSYEIQIATSSVGWDNPYWDSGEQVLASSIAVGVRTSMISSISFPQDGNSYYWRIRFRDDAGNLGAWSVGGDVFTISTPVSLSSHVLAKQGNTTIYPSYYNAYSLPSYLGGISAEQTIDCRAVDGTISDIILRGLNSTGGLTSNYLSDTNGHSSNVITWVSDSIFHSRSFHFSTPIPCQSGTLKISLVNVSGDGIAIDGSTDNVYPWGQCNNLACHTEKDIYFELIGTSGAPIVIPNAPTNLSVVNFSTSTTAFAWQDNANNEDGYTIERSLDGILFTTIATTTANTISFSDAGLTPGASYVYRARAFNIGAVSQYSNTVSVTTLPLPPLPPTDFVVATVSSSEIALAWTDNATNEDGYTVERSQNGVSYTVVASLVANTIDYSGTSLLPMTTYYYRIRSFNAGGVSSYATASTQTLAIAPSSPTALELNKSTNPIDVKTPKPSFTALFQDASSTALGASYQLQLSATGPNWSSLYWDSGKQSMNNTPVGTRSPLIHSGVLLPRDGTTYYWRIRFWDQFGNIGDWSTENATFTMFAR